MHGLRRWSELDQLEDLVAKDDRAFGASDVGANLERLLVRQRHHQFAVRLLDVADEVLKAVDEGLAVGLRRFRESFGIRAEEVCGAHHVDDLAREVTHALAVGFVQVIQAFDSGRDGLRRNQVLLLDEVEIGVLGPEIAGEPRVCRSVVLGRFKTSLHEALLCLDEVSQGLAPIRNLGLEHL